MTKKNQLSGSGLRFPWRTFRRDRVWYADGRGCSPPLGKHSLGTRDASEAAKLLAVLDHRMAVKTGLAVEAVDRASTKCMIGEGWTKYLDDCEGSEVLGAVADSSRRRYEAVADKHIPWCDERGIHFWHQFASDIAKQYGNWLSRQGYADRTILFEITQLTTVVKWLIKRKLLSASAVIDLPVRKPQGTSTYCYTREEVTAMVDYCRAQRGQEWLADVIIGLVTTGARISELANLRWRDVDLAMGTIVFRDERGSAKLKLFGTARRTKGRVSRAVPINPELDIVLRRLQRCDGGWVFRAPRGGQLRPNNILHALKTHVIPVLIARFPTIEGDIGFKDGTLHAFRHAFCSEAFVAGVEEWQIQEWMGHKSSQVTKLYRHRRRGHSHRRMQEIRFLESGREAT